MSGKSFFMLILTFGLIGFAYFYFERSLTEREIEITVVNSARYGSQQDKFFIFTPDEVFLDEDNTWQNKSNADDLFQELKKGKTYKVIVVGEHIPYISEYRNIIDIVEKDSKLKSHFGFNNY